MTTAKIGLDCAFHGRMSIVDEHRETRKTAGIVNDAPAVRSQGQRFPSNAPPHNSISYNGMYAALPPPNVMSGCADPR